MTDAPDGSPTPPFVQASRSAPTAARALRVLELLSVDPSRKYQLAELQRELRYSHGNLHAILATLVAMGHVCRDPMTRTYMLGPGLLTIGAAARETYPTVAVAQPLIDSLAEQLGTEAQAAMRVGDSILIVARAGPQLSFGRGVQVGERLPLTPPYGSTLMAWATEDDIDAYLATAAELLTTDEIDRHREGLRQVRRRGYSVHVYGATLRELNEAARKIVLDATDGDGESALVPRAPQLLREGYLAEAEQLPVGEEVQISAPVFDASGDVELSVGVALVAPRVSGAGVAAAPEHLLAATKAITAAIGGRARALV